MRDESITQAEIDALLGGGAQEAGLPGDVRPDGDGGTAAASRRTAALQAAIQEGARGLTALLGVQCQAVPGHVTETTAREAGNLLEGRLLVGRCTVSGGLSGQVYQVLPEAVGLALITRLYGGVEPTALDDSALGALADGLSRWNQGVITSLGKALQASVAAGEVQVGLAASLAEAGGIGPGNPVTALPIDLQVAAESGRFLQLFPREMLDGIEERLGGDGAETAADGASAPSEPPAPMADEAEVPAAPVTPAAPITPAAETAGPLALGETGAATVESSAPESAASGAAAPARSPAAGERTGQGAPAPAQFGALPLHAGAKGVRNLDILLAITLEMKVELGRVRRHVREVLAMGPGTVLELDKPAGDHADVLINDKVIARGEVVVKDENYGVRITEIISPGERVRSLQQPKE